MYNTAKLSPLSDFSPLTLMPTPSTPATSFACPVAAGDKLTLTVTNPQNPGAWGTLNVIPWVVSPAGTPLELNQGGPTPRPRLSVALG
jgi:hypothetical protein